MAPRAACARCYARRVKCDETRPSCRNCIRRGEVCPGYQSSDTLTWRDQNKKLQLRFGKRAQRQEQHDKDKTPRDVGTAVQVVPSLTNVKPSYNSRFDLIVRLSPIANSQVHRSTGFRLRTLGPGIVVNEWTPGFKSYLSFIPSRLGRNLALDKAVDCLTTTYVHRFGPSEVTKSDCLRSYVSAVQALRAHLASDELRFEVETLAATLLLGLYELIWCEHREVSSMTTHIHGAGHLIRLRGPTRHECMFGRALMLASQGPTIHETDTRERQEWHALMSTAPPSSRLEEDRPCHKLIFLGDDAFSRLLAHLDDLFSGKPNARTPQEIFQRAWLFRRRFYQLANDHFDGGGGSAEDAVAEFVPPPSQLTPPTSTAGEQDSTASDQAEEDKHQYPASSDPHRLVTALRDIMISPNTLPLDTGPYGNILGLVIVLNRILSCLYYYQSPLSPSSPPSSSWPSPQQLAHENDFLARQTLAMEEFMARARPVALLYYRASLVIARTFLDEKEKEEKQGGGGSGGGVITPVEEGEEEVEEKEREEEEGKEEEEKNWRQCVELRDWLGRIRAMGIECMFVR